MSFSLRKLLLVLLMAVGFLASFATSAQAMEDCSDKTNYRYFGVIPPNTLEAGGSTQFTAKGFSDTQSYDIVLSKWWSGDVSVITSFSSETVDVTLGPPLTNAGGKFDIAVHNKSASAIVEWCKLSTIEITGSNGCNITVDQDGFTDAQCIDATSGDMTLHVNNIIINQQPANGQVIKVSFQGGSGIIDPSNAFGPNFTEAASGGSISPHTFQVNSNAVGATFQVMASWPGGFLGLDEELCSTSVKVVDACSDEDRTTPDSDTTFDLCSQIPEDSDSYGKCARCVAGQDVDGSGTPAPPEVPLGIWTAVGCIKNDPQSIVTVVIKVGMGVAGGVALLMILAASFTISTSQGDAKKTDEGREMITSAVIGIVFIIMSVTLLQFIGVSIFRIPGFGDT